MHLLDMGSNVLTPMSVVQCRSKYLGVFDFVFGNTGGHLWLVQSSHAASLAAAAGSRL